MNNFYSKEMNQMKPSELKGWFSYKERGGFVPLADCCPAPECVKPEALKAVAGKTLEQLSGLTQESLAMGLPRLRVLLARYMKEEMAAGREEDTAMVTGAPYETLDLLCHVLTDPEDLVLCDSLLAPEALQVFAAHRLNLMTLEMDNDGMNPDHLEALLAANAGIRFLYVTPDFHVPTGNCITETRREKIAQICAKYGVLVIENAVNSRTRLYGEDILPIKSFDDGGAVIYMGSLGDVVTPGLAVSYLVADRNLLKRVSRYAERVGRLPSVWNQLFCEQFMESHSLFEEAETACEVYRDRYQNAVSVMEAEFPSDLYFTQPDGGFVFWCTDVSEKLDAEKLAEVMISKYGIAIAPGTLFAAGEDSASHSFRIGFAAVEEEVFNAAVKQLATEIRNMIEA